MASSLHQLLFRFVIPTHLNVLGSAFLFAYWAINLELFHLNVTFWKEEIICQLLDESLNLATWVWKRASQDFCPLI